MRKIKFFTHAILRTLPMLFCSPFLFSYITLLAIYACYDAFMPIKLFDYS